MPAAVASFAQNNSLIDVRQAQEDIKQGSSALNNVLAEESYHLRQGLVSARQHRNRPQHHLLPHLPNRPVLQQLAQ